jgi:hypothetical protein
MKSLFRALAKNRDKFVDLTPKNDDEHANAGLGLGGGALPGGNGTVSPEHLGDADKARINAVEYARQFVEPK